MATDPSMRASNADRERVAEQLSEHFAQGRLTPDEFHERLDAAYAAKTLGDLSSLTKDLPVEPAPQQAEPRTAPRPAHDWHGHLADRHAERLDRIHERMAERQDRIAARQDRIAERQERRAARYSDPRQAWASWALVSGICVLIWVVSATKGNGVQGFWPIWVIGPWGLVLLARTIRGGGRC